jgi:hypothetical protein
MAHWTKGYILRSGNSETGGSFETQNLWHKGTKILVAVAEVAGMPAITPENKKMLTQAINELEKSKRLKNGNKHRVHKRQTRA